MSCEQLLIFLAAGAGGGFIYALLSRGGVLILPQLTKLQDRYVLDLGFIGSMAIGAAVAVGVDNKPEMAFLAAIAGPSVLEALVAKVTAFIGVKPNGNPPTDGK